ncbi:hypothetical protein B9Z55_016761 [Caenorhabditis nigoni]|uniref:Uncharacterized protein n=3 Tax=Caenorhabditis nigoni TaxID=1611254 RepID=A0A2G5T6K1_9PELO|nr:hypothetical protein B9Z55_016761 [Caenorhabditis nigoni]
MELFYLVGFLEALIIILALCSSLYFLYLIANATFLQATSRPFLLLFTVSLFFLALTHGFQTFEFLIGIRPEDSTSYKDSIRMFVWSLLHEFAFALHTFSLFAFSVERYITAKNSIAQNLWNRTFSIIIAIIISILSMIYAQAIHLVNFHITLITCLNIVDMFALVILVLSSKISFKQYRNTAGKATLEQRFQISDVYIWTQALIPAACLAFLLKFIYVIVIWVLQSVGDSMEYQISVSHYFQNVMDLFTCGIPFLVSANHRRLNKSNFQMASEMKEMKVGWFIMTIFESILVVHSFLCSLFFMYLIANTKSLHSYCRVCLVMVGFSMNLFASYGFSIFEYLNSGQYYSLTEESASVRSKTWEFIHEFGMSEVYAWTNTLLPAVVGASIFKVLSMIPIWTWLLLGLTEWEYGIANFLYNNILNAYVCIFPWVLVYRNESLRKQILSTKHVSVSPDIESAKPIKTLEGKVISMRQSQEEYFDALKDSWDV